MEELKAKYYSELKKFLAIPQKFRGIQNTDNKKGSTFFNGIIEENAARFEGIYAGSNRLFDKLTKVFEQFQPWIVLGQINVEDTIEEHFRIAADWEEQLKMLKSKGREAERLPNEIKIDCILISTMSIKTVIDDLLHRLYDTLTWTLRHSITSQLQLMGQDLNSGIELLGTRPQTLDEVAEANQNHLKLAASSRQWSEAMGILEEKNALLRSVGGGGVENLNSLKSQFEKFSMMLESHEGVIKEQVSKQIPTIGVKLRNLLIRTCSSK